MKTTNIIYSILKEINDGNAEKLSANVYGLTLDEYGTIIEMMQDSKLIKDATIIKSNNGRKFEAIILVYVKITLAGIEYLNKNSALAKTYRGLKEIREWLPL